MEKFLWICDILKRDNCLTYKQVKYHLNNNIKHKIPINTYLI